MNPSVLVPIADGTEEMEAVILVDVLRRASIRVVVAGLHGLAVTAARGVRLTADARWSDARLLPFDAIALPGGAQGAASLLADPSVLALIREYHAAGKLVAAICAAPLVLQEAGILEGRQVTCHPAVRERLRTGIYRPERVVTDGHVLTSQGPGTSFSFALAIVARLAGAPQAEAVAAGMVL
jgi:4-methyl-5(b-hydroxyethyl)-thiazole monophosphate biosynthesis